MTTSILAATQHDFSKLALLVGRLFSSLHNSIAFARLCEAEWDAHGRIDAAALRRITKLSDMGPG